MTQVNMLEAKTHFSKLIRLLETKEEDEIIIARDNSPVAKIVLYVKPETSKRIGVAKGKHRPIDLETFNSLNDEIAKEFYGD
ncbi:MAG: hypothetical protein IKX97_05860 [Erysipelotrichaceae bacterium]|nr:hypothetical protein [Erysipelotrichaceae bacterium]MBR5755324.1 hypothetical protein [Erysipelotrichaceae bacterium]